MSFKVHKGGLLTTVQDGGRRGFQSTGMPVTGSIDMHAMHIANALVGNDLDEAVIECTIIGPTLEFLSDTIVAITGGDLTPLLNEKPMPMYKAVQIHAGDEISMRMVRSGCRAYIAFAGGLKIPEVMGSQSTYLKAGLGGFQGRGLKKGDEVHFNDPKIQLPNMDKRVYPQPKFTGECTVRVLMGPQDDRFTEKGINTFLTEEYTLTDKFDRMGCRTTGPMIEHKDDANILSDGISFGAIQVPDSGVPIIMLSDRQTVGGYTKIATIINVDMPLVAQSKAGDKIRFVKTDIETAQNEYIEHKLKLEEFERMLAEPEKAPEPTTPLYRGEAKQFNIVVNGKSFDVIVEEQ